MIAMKYHKQKSGELATTKALFSNKFTIQIEIVIYR